MGIFTRRKKLADYVVEGHESLLEEARARFKAAVEADQAQRELELDDLKFCSPDGQWPEDIASQRREEGRPCLTVDRINPFIHQLVNEFRQNRPQPQVNPVGDGADKDTAEIFQGMIRHIAYLSNGDVAVDTAFESMGRCGRGYFRLLTEYQDPLSFEQTLVIKRIPNLHSVVLDPAFTEPDGSDAEYGFITVWMPRDTYRKEYPNSKLAGLDVSDWDAIGDAAPGWVIGDNAVQVSEYYRRVRKPVKLSLLSDGSTVKRADVPEGATVEDERDSFEIEVQWFKLNAIEVLDETVWPDSEIPIFPMLGTELIVDGKRTWAGLIRSAKDAQRAFNFWKSAQAEAIALAPRAPWVGPKGFMGNMRHIWQSANKRPVAALEYEIGEDRANPLPPPQRIIQEPAIGAITQAMVGAVDDLKATTGMYDASLGNRESGQSGVAIRQLQRQGQVGNFHYLDNASRTIRRLGRVLVRVAPKIIDTERTIRIVRSDETSDTVTVNGPSGVKDKKTGLEKVYDLKTGTYDVTISVGPGYQTKRQENLALLESMLQGPMGQVLTQAAPDLVVSMMDFQIAPKLQERLKKLLPPQFQDEGEDGAQQIPPQAQQMLAMAQQKEQQAGQMIEALTAKVHELSDKLEDKQADIDAKIQIALIAKEQAEEVARINAGAGLEEAIAKVLGAGAVPELKAAIAKLEQDKDDLAELVLAHHSVIAPQSEPAEPGEAPEPVQSPQVMPMAGPMAGAPDEPAQPANAGPMAGQEQQ